MKNKINLVGTTFNYNDGAPKCSVWSTESKHIECVEQGGQRKIKKKKTKKKTMKKKK